ncbi:MAG: alpha/beta fold hydrolase [Paracoccaceae bacterium]
MRYSFADCILDIDGHRFHRAGQVIGLEPQVFDLLHLLVRNAGKLVSKDQLIDDVWNGRIVSEATVSARINAARTAVGDNGQAQAIIRTVPRRGFELVVPVEVVEEALAVVSAATPGRQTIRYAKSADGTAIAYAVSGSGPMLMRTSANLSHLELDWNSPFYRPVFDLLGQHFTVVRYDMRGTGLSDAEIEGTTIEHHIADMKAVADAAGMEKFRLLSTLQNTPVAIRLIAENPDRVTRLVIQNGYCKGRALRDGAPEDQEADPMIVLLQDGWGQPDNGYMRAWLSMFMPLASYEDVSGLIELVGRSTSAERAIQIRRLCNLFSAEGYLDQVDVPTLIIHARNDTIHPIKEAHELARGIEGAEFLVVESGNSLCIPSDPTWQQQMDALIGFLAQETF